MAAAVLFHFVLSPFYPDRRALSQAPEVSHVRLDVAPRVGDEDALDSLSVWHVLNWFMAAGVLIALAVTYLHKRDTGPDADTNTFVCVNVAFYAAATLAILFFWNWFDDLTVGEEGQSQTRLFFWVFTNTLFVILLGALSAHLWKDNART